MKKYTEHELLESMKRVGAGLGVAVTADNSSAAHRQILDSIHAFYGNHATAMVMEFGRELDFVLDLRRKQMPWYRQLVLRFMQ